MIVTCELDAVHGALVIVHWNMYAPAVVMPVMPEVAEEGVVIVGVTGPLMKLHAPVPVVAALPAIVAVPDVAQIVCGLPAAAVVGGAFTMTFTVLVEVAQALKVIVHFSAYVPAPPAGVNVDVALEVLLNCDASVEGPDVTDHAPVPWLGEFAASVTDEVVEQIVWFDPAAATVGPAVTVICEVLAVHTPFVTVHWST